MTHRPAHTTTIRYCHGDSRLAMPDERYAPGSAS